MDAIRTHVPIDREYRKTWKVVSETESYSIWSSDDEGEIHGTIVGVHLDSCTACMKCFEACPTKVFGTISGDVPDIVIPSRERDCIFCMVCELTCPTDAISINKHVGSDETLDSLLGNV